MTLEQFSSSPGGRWDIEAIRRLWDEALQRMKVRVELAECETKAARADPDSTRSINNDEAQTERGIVDGRFRSPSDKE